MTPGQYIGTIVDWGFSETKAGDPQVLIKLKSGQFQVTWFGSLKNEKAQQITIKTLVACGFMGDDISVLAEGNSTSALDTAKELKFEVVTENYNGKDYTKVKWISDPNDSSFAKKMDRKVVSTKISGLNLKGLLKEEQSKVIPF